MKKAAGTTTTKRFRFTVMSVALFTIVLPVINAQNASSTQTDQYLIEFRGDGVPTDLSARISSLGGKVVDVFPELKVAVVGNLSAQAATTLSSQADIADVTEDEFVTASRYPQARAMQFSRITANSLSSQPETAFFYPYQWDKRAISADKAWQAGYLGSPDVRVAILDTGADPTNPDIAGLIDHSRSTSFCPDENALIQQEFPGYPTWTDVYGHGTGVASMAASGGQYVAGVSSKTSLMAIKTLGLLPCRSSSIVRGIVYAANHGADVINISAGSEFAFTRSGSKNFVHYDHLAVQYALVKGVSAVVVSAGNSSFDFDHSGNFVQEFCDVPGVICVSATGAADSGPELLGPFTDPDSVAFYTNFGSSAIDVAAPGGNGVLDPTGTFLLSAGWIWEACPRTTLTFDQLGNIVPIDYCGPYPVWGTIGTSESAPQVSGLAALLVARLGHGKSAQVRAAIENSADDLGKPGVDPYYGKGRINVARALGVQ